MEHRTTSDAAGATLAEHVRMAQVLLPCRDLAATLAFFTDRLGFKVNLIFPADSPHTAVVSGHGLTLRLETGAPAAPMTLRLLCDLAALPDRHAACADIAGRHPHRTGGSAFAGRGSRRAPRNSC